MKDVKNIKFVLSAVFVFLFLSTTAFAQQPSLTPPATDDEDVVKISTTLIQVDVSVTDKNGKQVTDVKPEDFEIFENGSRQEITNFSYVSVMPRTNAEAAQTQARTKSEKERIKLLPPVPTKLKPNEVRRTIALVVDDLGIASSFAPIQPDFKEELNASVNAATGESGRVLGTEQDLEAERTFNLFREDGFAVGTLGAVNYVVRGMGELPGRKAVMLFSEGFGVNSRIVGAMRNLAELANRSGTILYAVDPRGLVAPGPNAEDSFVGLSSSPFVVENALSQRDGTLRRTQQSL